VKKSAPRARNERSSLPRAFGRVFLRVATAVVLVLARLADVSALAARLDADDVARLRASAKMRARVAALRRDELAIAVAIALLGWALDRALIAIRDRLIRWERLDSYYAE